MLDKKAIYENMKELVEVPGISGTDAEKAVAFKIEEMLKRIPYFQEHPENIKLVPLENDPFERSIVTAFLQINPDCPDTVILTGHYDVVDIEEFGHLQDIAFDIESVTKRINEMPLDEDSLKDYQSGEWLFGRGTADMKFGHGLCMELLRYYSENNVINGNLLYVAVCGEETNSEGMLRAVKFFNDFAEEKDIRYTALLLTECFMMEDQANDTNKYIHYGASGKIMPMFFFVGEATHAGEPFLGFDPSLVSAEVYRKLQLNIDFCQERFGEFTPPPVCLKMQDLKSTYSASTPLYSVAYYTIITVNIDPEDTIIKLKKIAYDAMTDSIKLINKRADEYSGFIGNDVVKYEYKPCVMTLDELQKGVEKTFDGDLQEHLKEYALNLQKQKMEMQDIAVQLVKHIYELYKDKRPMVILSFIPPYYPDVYLEKSDEDVNRLMKACDSVISYAKEKYGETLKMKDFYMGISDMCYTGLDKDMNFDNLFKNLAGIGSVYNFPAEDMKKFRVPGIVLGGYGKDFHKHTERLHKKYNFEILPDLYIRLINDILK